VDRARDFAHWLTRAAQVERSTVRYWRICDLPLGTRNVGFEEISKSVFATEMVTCAKAMCETSIRIGVRPR
jgi:hypothetical protein